MNHGFKNHLRFMAAEQIHVKAAKEADPVAVPLDPLFKRGDSILIRMLRVNAGLDQVMLIGFPVHTRTAPGWWAGLKNAF